MVVGIETSTKSAETIAVTKTGRLHMRPAETYHYLLLIHATTFSGSACKVELENVKGSCLFPYSEILQNFSLEEFLRGLL